jgi:hypothetical protein
LITSYAGLPNLRWTRQESYLTRALLSFQGSAALGGPSAPSEYHRPARFQDSSFGPGGQALFSSEQKTLFEPLGPGSSPPQRPLACSRSEGYTAGGSACHQDS